MTGFFGYVWDLLIYFSFVGIGLHLLDRFVGVKFYRYWYNRSREEPIPEELEVGFMYNRPFARRHKIVLWISGLQSIYMLFFHKIHPLTELVAFALEAWAMLVGFALGKYFYSFIKGEEKFVETIQKMSPASLLKTARMWVGELWGSVFARAPAPAPQAPQPAVVEEKKAEPPQPHWRERLDSLTNKRGGSR